MNKPNINLAIVVSKFNAEVTDKLLQGALLRLQELEINASKIIKVPGAIEIPLVAKLLAQTKKYHAIICLGVVIRGETGHYDYVCQQVSQGCMQVMLQFDIPVIFGVLTTDDLEQALARAGGSEGNKGVDAVNAALEMVDVVRGLT